MLEILIIVFAVSLSIWLHSLSEHSHKAAEVKTFLTGLKIDLKSDVLEMKKDREMFVGSKKAFSYLRSLKKGQPAESDSINKYGPYMFNSTGLVANNSRFEGFKSSGKIGTIENLKIQNDIMDLYQENIPMLVLFTNFNSQQKIKLKDYYYKNLQRITDDKNNSLQLFSSDYMFNLSYDLVEVQHIINQYDKCIASMNSIITEIDKEYKH